MSQATPLSLPEWLAWTVDLICNAWQLRNPTPTGPEGSGGSGGFLRMDATQEEKSI
jgi:hypothetical protein